MRRPPLSIAVRLFLTGWVVYALHFATDIVREHYPAFSLAERGTLRVDPYVGLHPDLFEIPGRGAFINNNPGASVVGAIPYALTRPMLEPIAERAAALRRTGPTPGYDDPRPMRRAFFARAYEQGLDVRFGLAAGVIQALAVAPLSAAMLVVMFGLLQRLGFSRREATALSLVYGFATPLFFRTAFLNHNLLVAHATLGSFALLTRRDGIETRPPRLALAGVVLGAGLLCDYAGAVPVIAVGLYALDRLLRALPPPEAAAGFAALVGGAAVPVAALLAYQAWAFGHPAFPAQHYMPATQYSGFGWNGFDWPASDLLWQNLFDLRFGLVPFGPLLVLAFGQPWLARRAAGVRPAIDGAVRALALGLFLALLVFTSANQYARLQWNTGFRMLAPAVPLLFLLCADSLARLPRRVSTTLVALAGLHAWCLAMVRADVATSLATVATSGPRLPWLTSLGRAGTTYLPPSLVGLPDGLLPLPFLAVGCLMVAWIWTRAAQER